MSKRLLRIFIAAFIIRFVLAFVTWHPDVFNHMDWGVRFFEYGPQQFYKANVWNFTWPNQPPGTIYMFAVVRKLYEVVFDVFWWINVNISIFPSGIITYFESNLYPTLLKLPAILADICIAYLIYKILVLKDLKKYAGYAVVVFLVNPVIWYNSTIWGQYDSVINFFALLSVHFLFKKKLLFAVLSYFISVYIKASLLVFAPLFLVYAIKQRYSLNTWIRSILLSALVIALLTYPFADKNVFVWLFELYKDKVFTDQLQVVTANAFNLWGALFGIKADPRVFPHSDIFLGFSYQIWGIILFGISYLPALYLIIKKQDFKNLFWSMAVVAFSSFILLTNMHERYLYPLFIPFTVLLAVDRKLVKYYLVVSTINLINLYNFWWTPRIDQIVELMSVNDRLIPRILGFFNLGLFVAFYKKFLRQNKLTKI